MKKAIKTIAGIALAIAFLLLAGQVGADEIDYEARHNSEPATCQQVTIATGTTICQ